MARTPILIVAAGLLAAVMPESPQTIVDLQQFRQTSSARVRSGSGTEGIATLFNLNPTINSWYLLTLNWNGTAPTSWHLENPRPHTARVVLEQNHPAGKLSTLVVLDGGNRYPCDLPENGELEKGRGSELIYYPLCGGRLYLRNPARGQRTALEAATEFLRNQVWGGERVIVLFHHLLADRYRETGAVEDGNTAAASSPTVGQPLPALVDPANAGHFIVAENLGIDLESGRGKGGMAPGAWYPAAGNPGVYVSVLQPGFAAPTILQSYKNRVSSLDRIEASSLCYLIAFDLDRMGLGYALGTSYPGVGWSDRVPQEKRDPSIPGPDGIGGIAPLVSTGLIAPEDGRRTVAAFTGGFKRTHGAFRYGDLALKNHGSHYGFIQNGVVFSKLQAGLATVLVLDDGSIEMKTWAEADNRMLARIRHARQNGVPLVEFDDTTRSTVPGALVARWGAGNWSGSEDERLRTIRGGLALQKSNGKTFLIYAVFSDATPSAMARVFQAYLCRYAMLLDMNALEHTYLAVYRRSGSELAVNHLLKGMSQLDQSGAGGIVPRFLGYPDNRDFFYVMRRSARGE